MKWRLATFLSLKDIESFNYLNSLGDWMCIYVLRSADVTVEDVCAIICHLEMQSCYKCETRRVETRKQQGAASFGSWRLLKATEAPGRQTPWTPTEQPYPRQRRAVRPKRHRHQTSLWSPKYHPVLLTSTKAKCLWIFFVDILELTWLDLCWNRLNQNKIWNHRLYYVNYNFIWYYKHK